MKFVILMILSIAIRAERKLQVYEGTVTEISCSTAIPSFLINGIYSSFHYDRLPELFGIEARVAPDRKNVTLRVNGTSLTDNVTIECQNIVDAVSGQTETLFQFTVVFIDILPPPTNIHLNANALFWAAPIHFQSPFNETTIIRIDPQIIHYQVYIVDLSINTEFSVKSRYPNMSFPCVYSVQVSAVNSVREGEKSSSAIINNCAHGIDTTDENGKTGMEESSHHHNQTFTSQVITTVGHGHVNKTEELPTFTAATLVIMISLITLTGSVATVSLFLNCVLFTVLIRKARENPKLDKKYQTTFTEKHDQNVIMEQNEAYACAASLNRTYANICAHHVH